MRVGHVGQKCDGSRHYPLLKSTGPSHPALLDPAVLSRCGPGKVARHSWLERSHKGISPETAV